MITFANERRSQTEPHHLKPRSGVRIYIATSYVGEDRTFCRVFRRWLNPYLSFYCFTVTSGALKTLPQQV